MKVMLALVAVLALFLLAAVGVQAAGLQTLFGVVLPYAALAIFFVGVVYRVLRWAKSPVPFRIPTTCGQQKSLSWIQHDKLENPFTKAQVLGRMTLEILLFRSLFRNTRTELNGGKVVFGPNKWLWGAGLLFHWSMLVIVLRHLRFFTEPVPAFIGWIQSIDGFLQVGVPVVFATTIVFLGALLFLFVRRVWSPQLRYISLVNDYFPLFLLLGIGTTGLLMRHFMKTDLEGVKELAIGLVSFHPVVPSGLSYLFFGHLFLVSVLLAYFPFSKLMHSAGVFLSPTRNLANNNRAVRHVNPWDYPVKIRTYAEYEDEFRERMIEAGLPVEKTASESSPEKPAAANEASPALVGKE